jgi:hypothetical protein
MGGLLAARVLADFFRTVTVVERDELPDDPANRRGVPQGRHVHALVPCGAEVLDELFPGFLSELVAGGAPVWDDAELSKLYLSYYEALKTLCRNYRERQRPLSVQLILREPWKRWGGERRRIG